MKPKQNNCDFTLGEYFENTKYTISVYVQLFRFLLLERTKTRILFDIAITCFSIWIIYLLSEWIVICWIFTRIIPNLDFDSARYFFSAAAQSLSALFAISFAVLLTFTQIMHNEHSDSQLKNIYFSKIAVANLILFPFTILFSFHKLSKIVSPVTNSNSIQLYLVNSELLFNENNWLTSSLYPNTISVLFVIILSFLCISLLILLLYSFLTQIKAVNYIRKLNETVFKKIDLEFSTRKVFREYRDFLIEVISRCKNVILEKYLAFKILDWSDENIIYSLNKSGYITSINLKRLQFCSHKLKNIDPSGIIRLNILNESVHFTTESVLGTVEIPKISEEKDEVSKINDMKFCVVSSVKMNENFRGLFDYEDYFSAVLKIYSNTIPIADTITAKKIIEEQFQLINKYIQHRKDYDYILPYIVAKENFYSKSFLSQFFNSFTTLLKVILKNEDIVLYHTLDDNFGNTGSIAIKTYDFEVFFALGSLLKQTSVDFVQYSDEISKPLTLSITNKLKTTLLYNETIEIAEMPAIILNNFAYELESIYINILIKLIDSNNKKYSVPTLESITIFNDDVYSKITRNYTENLDFELTYQKQIQSDIFKLGMFVMYRVEKSKISIEHARELFLIIAKFFKHIGISEVLNSPESPFISIDSWKDEIKSKATIEISNEKDRFLVILLTQMQKLGRDLPKNVENQYWLTERQLDKCKTECKKLRSESNLWKDVLNLEKPEEDFKQTIDLLNEKVKERTEFIENNLPKQPLDKLKVDKFREEKIQELKRTPLSSQIIEVKMEDEIVENGWNEIKLTTNLPKQPFVSGELTPFTASIFVYNPFFDYSSQEYKFTLEMIIKSIDWASAEKFNSLKQINYEFLIEQIRGSGYSATTIISSPDLKSNLKDLDDLDKTSFKRHNYINCIGFLHGIPVIIAQDISLPKGSILIYDKTAFGLLSVQNEFSVQISDCGEEADLTVSRYVKFSEKKNDDCYIAIKIAEMG